MYSTDGEFGKVRLVSHTPSRRALEGLFCFSSAGWHRCNDQYLMFRSGEQAGFYQLIFTLDGCGCLEVDGTQMRLKAGSVAVMPPGLAHSYCTNTGEEWEFYWMILCGDLAQRMLSLLPQGIFWAEAPAQQLGRRMEELLFTKKGGGVDLELKISGLVYSVLAEVLLSFAHNGQGEGVGGLTMAQKAMEYMEKHYSEPLTLERVGEALFVSKTHLIRTMREQTGYTPYQYLTMIRVQKAEEMLHFGDVTVEQAARAVGFQETSNFIRQYKRLKGKTPGQELPSRR